MIELQILQNNANQTLQIAKIINKDTIKTMSGLPDPPKVSKPTPARDTPGSTFLTEADMIQTSATPTIPSTKPTTVESKRSSSRPTTPHALKRGTSIGSMQPEPYTRSSKTPDLVPKIKNFETIQESSKLLVDYNSEWNKLDRIVEQIDKENLMDELNGLKTASKASTEPKYVPDKRNAFLALKNALEKKLTIPLMQPRRRNNLFKEALKSDPFGDTRFSKGSKTKSDFNIEKYI